MPESLTKTRTAAVLLLAMMLTACVSAPGPKLARYDIGGDGQETVRSNTAGPIALASITVSSVPWLDARDMHYRFLYAEPQRRYSFVEAQWVAPPGQMLERAMRRQMPLASGQATGSGCRLLLVIDELDQRFESAAKSAVQLEARASLHSARGDAVVATRAFTIDQATSTADAKGGAAAAGVAGQRLINELAHWLTALPAASAKRCANDS